MVALPELIVSIFQPLQIVAYVFFILFFGSIIIRGFRGYLPWHMRLLGRLGFGFIALVCSVSLSNIMPFAVTGIYKIMQVDFFASAIISTAVLTISLYLISTKLYNVGGMEKAMERLRVRLEKAKSVEKEMAGKSVFQRIGQPARIAGIAILAFFIIFSLIYFQGFPDMSERVLSGVYETANFMESASSNQTFSEECVTPLELAQNFGESILNGELPLYTDQTIQSLIESRSGEAVYQMYRIEYKQRTYALAITVKQSLCSATGQQFCGCINLGSVV